MAAVSLPNELWAEILMYAIHPRFLLDEECKPEHISLFHDSLTIETKSSLTPHSNRHYNESEQTRNKMKRVCKLWSHIINSIPPYIAFWRENRRRHKYRQKLGREERLEVNYKDIMTTTYPGSVPIQSRLRVLSLTLQLNPHRMRSESTINDGVEAVYRRFFSPHTKVFHLSAPILRVGYFSMMEECFQGLTTLSIFYLDVLTLPMQLTLPNLRVLFLSQGGLGDNSLDEWHLPNLATFSCCELLNTFEPVPTTVYTLIKNHAVTLEAIQLLQYYVPSPWDFLLELDLPRLRCISGSRLPDRLPPAIQIEHVIIPSSFWFSPDHTFELVKHSQGLKTVQIPFSNGWGRQVTVYTGEDWQKLLENKGIKLLNEDRIESAVC